MKEEGADIRAMIKGEFTTLTFGLGGVCEILLNSWVSSPQSAEACREPAREEHSAIHGSLAFVSICLHSSDNA